MDNNDNRNGGAANVFEEVRCGFWTPANDNRPQVHLMLTCACGNGVDTHVLADVDLKPIVDAWRRGHLGHQWVHFRAAA